MSHMKFSQNKVHPIILFANLAYPAYKSCTYVHTTNCLSSSENVPFPNLPSTCYNVGLNPPPNICPLGNLCLCSPT